MSLFRNVLHVVLGVLVGLMPHAYAQEVIGVYNAAEALAKNNGVERGGVVFTPSMRTSISFNDNIYATPTATSDKIITITPALDARSEWSKHGVYANAFVDVNEYTENDSESITNSGVGLGGHVDMYRGLTFFTNTSYKKLHEARNAVDDVNAQTPTAYTDKMLEASVLYKPQRIGVGIGYVVHERDYENTLAQNGSVVNNNQRDRTEKTFYINTPITLSPATTLTPKLAFKEVEYDTVSNQDSDGYSIDIGLDHQLSGKLHVGGEVGYTTRDYSAATLTDIDTLSFGLNAGWRFAPLTSLSVDWQRNVNDTVVSGASGYITSSLTTRIEHELRRYWVAGADVQFEHINFKGISRSDERTRVGADTRYYLTPKAYVNVGYSWFNSDSDIANDRYDSHIVTVSLGVKL